MGKILPCIIECYSDDGEVIARTQYDAPEIDGFIFINTDEELRSGDMISCIVTSAYAYDLIGEKL